MFQASRILIFLGGLCYYLALPPLNLAPLALAVPVLWGIVISKEQQHSRCLYATVFITAFLFWLASIWWIACPHPLTALGLVALSAFLSLYWLLFFISARTAVHRFRVPLLVAMPVCWMGTEYLRCHILGGFSFCALEHTFYLYPVLIQLASVGGSLLVGGGIMLLGASLCVPCLFVVNFLTANMQKTQEKTNCIPVQFINPVPGCIVLHLLFCLLIALIVPLIVVSIRTVHSNPSNDGTKFCIVALQGNRQVYLHSTFDEAKNNFMQFRDLTYQEIGKRKQNGDPLPDAIIFPETVCPISVLEFEGLVKPTDLGGTEEEVMAWERHFREFAQDIDTPVILGLSTLIFKDEPDNPIRLNSALLVQPTPISPVSSMYRYDKMHLVMFGEYIPFAEYLPDNFILKTLCPEAHRGTKPTAFPIGQWREGNKPIEASVNICFESTVAHLIRNQILTLRKEGHDPRLLINMSNDGWFRNSHQMEQHMATHVFRAVENRMWYVTATNGGYSAIIDPHGVIRSIGKRGEAEAVASTIWVNINEPHALTIYQRLGDGYALVFALLVLGLAAIHIRDVTCSSSVRGRGEPKGQSIS